MIERREVGKRLWCGDCSDVMARASVGHVLKYCRTGTEVVDCWMDGPEKVHGQARVVNKGRLYLRTDVVLFSPIRNGWAAALTLQHVKHNQQVPHWVRHQEQLTVGGSERCRRT